MKSYIADNVMKEYKNKKRYEKNKLWSEEQNFVKQNCVNCKNKTTNLCHINRNIEGKLNCAYKEI